MESGYVRLMCTVHTHMAIYTDLLTCTCACEAEVSEISLHAVICYETCAPPDTEERSEEVSEEWCNGMLWHIYLV